MENEKDRGWMYHAYAAGFVAAFAVFGYVREMAQHDWEWSLSPHQLWEASWWPGGAAIVLAVGFIVVVIIRRRWKKE